MNTVVTRVRVYFNIHRRMFSVQKKTEKGWRLWCHTDFMFLKNVRFIVNEQARLKVIERRRKSVHAFIEGDIPNTGEDKFYGKTEVKYNPYHCGNFVTVPDLQGEFIPVLKANAVSCQLNSQRKPRIYCEL